MTDSMRGRVCPPGLDPDQIEIIRAWARTIPRIQLVYLFGSRAKGDFRAGSDVDLAVILTEDRNETAMGLWIVSKSIWHDQLASRLPFDVQLEMPMPDDEIVAPAVREHGVLIYSVSLDG